MTLDARIGGVHIIEPRRVEDGRAYRAADVLTAWAVAPLATHIPLGDGFVRDVVVYGMAAVAERPRRPLEVVGRIKGRPPISIVGYEVTFPHLVRDVPLRGVREKVIANFCEIALLPS